MRSPSRRTGSRVSWPPSGRSSVSGSFRSGDQAAEAHRQAGLADDVGQGRHVLQIEQVARVVLRNDQETPRVAAHIFSTAMLGRLHRQGQEIPVQVVEAAGEQVGVHRRQLEAGIAQVHRAVERRVVLHPLPAEPVLDVGWASMTCFSSCSRGPVRAVVRWGTMAGR
jgi:hypothetical protein